jgi:hypothetical protein
VAATAFVAASAAGSALALPAASAKHLPCGGEHLSLNASSAHAAVGQNVVLRVRVCSQQTGSGYRVELQSSEGNARHFHGSGGVCPLRHRTTNCRFTVTSGVEGSVQYEAVLVLFTRHGPHGAKEVLATSNRVSITFGGSAAPPPTELALTAAGAERSVNIDTGALTCTGSGTAAGTSCDAMWPENTALPITASVDQPLPTGWTLEIDYDPAPAPNPSKCEPTILASFGDCAIALVTTGESVSASAQLPCQSQTHGVVVKATVRNPQGYVASALNVGPEPGSPPC